MAQYTCFERCCCLFQRNTTGVLRYPSRSDWDMKYVVRMRVKHGASQLHWGGLQLCSAATALDSFCDFSGLKLFCLLTE